MLKIATYNIQFSLHPEAIERNVIEIVNQGVSVICLQEVLIHSKKNNITSRILDRLGADWDIACHLGETFDLFSMGTCILWNKTQVKSVSVKKFALPFSEKLKFPEKVFSILAGGVDSPFLRRIISVEFKLKRKKFRVTNVHLDHNGGRNNRKKQLLHLVNKLDNNREFDFEIICGDFNNLDTSKDNFENQMIESILVGFTEATRNLMWTADLYYIDTSKGVIFLEKFVKLFNIHLRKKLDYIWTKNVEHNESYRLLLEGSDHFPIISTLKT